MGNRKGLKQLSMYISEELHTEIKRSARMRKITIKDYILELHAVSAGKIPQTKIRSKTILVCIGCGLMFGSFYDCITHIDKFKGTNEKQHNKFPQIDRSKTKYRGKNGWDCLIDGCNTNYVDFIDIARHQQKEHALFPKYNLD